MTYPVKIFVIYAREDSPYKEGLIRALRLLKKQGLVDAWHDEHINAGEEWDKQIRINLQSADIIIPLVSYDFYASEYIQETEIEKAFERYHKNETVISPVIVRDCPWYDDTRLAKLQVLPKDGKPISTWSDKDEAYTNVIESLKSVIYAIQKSPNWQERQRRFKKEMSFRNESDTDRKLDMLFDTFMDVENFKHDEISKRKQTELEIGEMADRIRNLESELEIQKGEIENLRQLLETKRSSEYIKFKSPMVGTFYRSAGPDKPPYVKVGDHVKKGDVICIVEAMKLFNEIECDVKGKILEILVPDATLVDYDQPLFIIDPS